MAVRAPTARRWGAREAKGGEMAEDEEPEEGAEEGKGGGAGKILLILGAINTLGLLGLAAFVVLGGGGDAPMSPEKGMEAAEMQAAAAGRPGGAEGEPGPMMELGTLVVNLREPTGDRYLKTKIQLELDSEETRAEVESRLSQIRYQITMLLSGQRVADVQGPESMEALRKAMIRRVNASLSKGRVVGVWPDEWIVQ